MALYRRTCTPESRINKHTYSFYTALFIPSSWEVRFLKIACEVLFSHFGWLKKESMCLSDKTWPWTFAFQLKTRLIFKGQTKEEMKSRKLYLAFWILIYQQGNIAVFSIQRYSLPKQRIKPFPSCGCCFLRLPFALLTEPGRPHVLLVLVSACERFPPG